MKQVNFNITNTAQYMYCFVQINIKHCASKDCGSQIHDAIGQYIAGAFSRSLTALDY